MILRAAAKQNGHLKKNSKKCLQTVFPAIRVMPFLMILRSTYRDLAGAKSFRAEQSSAGPSSRCAGSTGCRDGRLYFVALSMLATRPIGFEPVRQHNLAPVPAHRSPQFAGGTFRETFGRLAIPISLTCCFLGKGGDVQEAKSPQLKSDVATNRQDQEGPRCARTAPV